MDISWHEKIVNVSDLKPYERNPRKISQGAMDKLKASILANGYHQRILAQPNGTVICGHQRIKAFMELGVSQVTVLMPDRELTNEEFRKILVQDNIPFGEFNFDILKDDFKINELEDWGMPKEWIKKVPDVLVEGLTDADEVPALPADPRSRLGDVWLMGNHRIMCGDSTDADVVSKLLGNIKPHLMVTDPPYGVEYDANWRNEAERFLEGRGICAIGAGAIGKVENDNRADWREAWSLFPGDVAYVWCSSLHSHDVAQSLIISDFALRSQIIWDKTRLIISRGDYQWQHEPCWYAVRNKKTGHFNGDRKQTTIWSINHQKSETGHSTQKPVECMRRPMENNSHPGDAVYEPFSGSGTTIIAAEMTQRHCFAIELNPAYVDMAVLRWQKFTGKHAILESTGEKFDV